MVEKDNYATTSPLNEGSTVDNLQPNTNYIDSPFGNVKIYDLDAEIPPIERMQIVPNVSNLAPSIPTTTPAISEVSETTTTIAPMASKSYNKYWLYGGAYVLVALVAYKIYKK